MIQTKEQKLAALTRHMAELGIAMATEKEELLPYCRDIAKRGWLSAELASAFVQCPSAAHIDPPAFDNVRRLLLADIKAQLDSMIDSGVRYQSMAATSKLSNDQIDSLISAFLGARR